MNATLYWHDYETFGAVPRRDRPAQFAGIRTDEALNEISEPLVIYCKPARDVLPHPEACLLTGITPQTAERHGVCEAEFIQQIHAELAQPCTCGVGYNTLRFDDEVTRYTLYRNFYDPYAREWQQGNSRWDIIDLARMTYALRPAGIEWPLREDGSPSFRLEDLVAANGIEQESAHDALSDVRATIGFARLLRIQQPRLYNWLFQLRNKYKAAQQLDLVTHTQVVHTSRMYPAITGCTTLVAPLIAELRNNNSILVYDLRHDPSAFIEMSVDSLKEYLFIRTKDRPSGEQRLPVKSVKVNKCPALAPRNTLDEQAAERIAIDPDVCQRHWQQIVDNEAFIKRIAQAYADQVFDSESDVDQALYDGFIDRADAPLMEQVRCATPQELSQLQINFTDKRLPELLFRYRARNWPETLSQSEMQKWQQFCHQRLIGSDGSHCMTLEEFTTLTAALRDEYKDDERAQQILYDLDKWKKNLWIPPTKNR